VKAILMLIPVALALGSIGLIAFLWSLKSGQFEDLDGAANRILFDYDEPAAKPLDEAAVTPAESPETADKPKA